MSIAIILCGGVGERISSSKFLPKTLIKINDQCILDFVLLQAAELWVDRILIVTNRVNYMAIKDYITALNINGIPIEVCIANHASLGNGMTLYEGLKNSASDFFVLMADHLIERKAMQLFRAAVQQRNGSVPLLACDLDIATIFDIDDATKVNLQDDQITQIGKNLKKYNAIDMGLFFFPECYRKTIKTAIEQGACSLTEIVQFILRDHIFYAVLMQNIKWQDIDTPQMLNQAVKQFEIT